jgi:pimeloyl-ACP methyl ester carboxylesterase
VIRIRGLREFALRRYLASPNEAGLELIEVGLAGLGRPAALLTALSGGGANFTDLVAALRTLPTVVLTGEHDRLAPADDAQRWFGSIVDVDIRTVPRSGHWLPLEDPRGIAASVTDLLDRGDIWGAGPT